MVESEAGTVLQQTDYYPFGTAFAVGNTNINKYLYGGKELQDEVLSGTSVSMYDFHARFLDGQHIPAWTSIDPLAEKYYNVSPYVYANNNPVLYVDPDGKEPGFWDTVMEYLTSFFSQAKPGHNEEVYERAYVENDRQAQQEIQQVETVEAVLNAEVTPYVSFSIGKESGEAGPLGFFFGGTYTTSGLYITGGFDQTVGTPSMFSGISISISFGIFIGPESGIEGAGIGIGGGSFIGSTVSAPMPGIESSSTYGLGVTIGNTPAWGSINESYTMPVLKFRDEQKKK